MTNRHCRTNTGSTEPRSKMATEPEEMLANIGIYVIFLNYGATGVQIKDMGTHIYHLINLNLGL